MTHIAHAYETSTHAEMSERAALRTTLNDSTGVLSDLGLQPLMTQKFFGQTIIELIRRGAVDEDDIPPILDPSGLRFVNHFYNPLNGEGFTHPILPNGLPSPLWGLEDGGNIRGQDRSFIDARANFLSALTATTPRDREVGFTGMFITLGHVAHLIQDSGQPEHTRNDSHGSGSLYERITNDMVSSLPYDGYPNVVVNAAREFWHTQPNDLDPFNNISNKKGLAEYSNRGFVSDNTNFVVTNGVVSNTTGLPSPIYDETTQLLVDIKTLDPTTTLVGNVEFYGNTVVDSYDSTRTQFNQFATSRSIFDSSLTFYTSAGSDGRGFFSLNRFNFFRAQGFLIPRSVGYSAGLIDYFFRGKINLENDQNDSTRLLISNLGNEEINGTFKLYYDNNDIRRQVPGAEWTTGDFAIGGVLASGESMSVPRFTIPSFPAPSISGEYTIVFVGTIGSENPTANSIGAVAGKKITLTSGGHPNTLLSTSFNNIGNCTFYESSDEGLSWTLISTISETFCSSSQRTIYMGDGTVLLFTESTATNFGYSVVYRSDDGGHTWIKTLDGSYLPFFVQGENESWAYIGNNTILASDSNNFTQITSDNGLTWTRLGKMHPLPVFRNRFHIGTTYLGNDVILAVKRFELGPFLTRSLDGGQTWSFLHFSTPLWSVRFLSTMVNLGNNQLLVTSSGELAYRSTDGGENWSVVADSQSPILGGSLIYLGNDTLLVYRPRSPAPLAISRDAGLTASPHGSVLPNTFLSIVYLGDNGAVPRLYD